MKTMVSAQIWRSSNGVERVWGLGVPKDEKATPLLNGERHSYVRNEDRNGRSTKFSAWRGACEDLRRGGAQGLAAFRSS